MFLVNYGKSVKGRVKKDKPTRYRGYASKVSIAAFEIDEYDTIGYWLTPEEYEKLSDKEKQKYSYYEWDEYDDWYRVYNLIVDRVDTISAISADGQNMLSRMQIRTKHAQLLTMSGCSYIGVENRQNI